MKISIFFMLIFIRPLGFLEPDDVVVVRNRIMLNDKTIEIKCYPPLIRNRNEGSILISIEEEW